MFFNLRYILIHNTQFCFDSYFYAKFGGGGGWVSLPLYFAICWNSHFPLTSHNSPKHHLSGLNVRAMHFHWSKVRKKQKNKTRVPVCIEYFGSWLRFSWTYFLPLQVSSTCLVDFHSACTSKQNKKHKSTLSLVISFVFFFPQIFMMAQHWLSNSHCIMFRMHYIQRLRALPHYCKKIYKNKKGTKLGDNLAPQSCS